MAVKKRGFFEAIFGPRQKIPLNNVAVYKGLNGFQPIFYAFGSDHYAMDTVRKAVDTIAGHAAKLHPRHIRRGRDGKIIQSSGALDYLIGVRPNPAMSGFEFRYKLITCLLMNNNAFAYPKFDDYGNLIELWPIPATQAELHEGVGGMMLVKFKFSGGRSAWLPYSDVIHLRRHFYADEMWGEPNERALGDVLELASTINQGIYNALRVMFNFFGILTVPNVVDEADLKAMRDAFMNTYADMTKSGGVTIRDKRTEYEPLESKAAAPTAEMVRLLEDKVYSYFGINRSIVEGNYTEAQGLAFYDSIIARIATQLSEEFTEKLFTPRERGFGNEIYFESARMQFVGPKTKAELIKTGGMVGMWTLNEMRGWFGDGPVEGGDRRVQTLNVVDANKANKYQTGDDDDGNPGEAQEDDAAEDGVPNSGG